jgi:hypothetical protein
MGKKYMYDPVVSEEEVEEARPHEWPSLDYPAKIPESLDRMDELELEKVLARRFDRCFKVRKVQRGTIPYLQVQDMATKKMFRIGPEEFRLCNTKAIDRLYTRIQDRMENNRIDNGT